MSQAITRRVAHWAFARLNAGDTESLLARCHPGVHHRFAGQHALGGERRGVARLRAWFARLERLFTELRFEVNDVLVAGPPWATRATVVWRDYGRSADGEAYANQGIHRSRLRWGRLTAISAHRPTQLLTTACSRRAACGIDEAAAAPIED